MGAHWRLNHLDALSAVNTPARWYSPATYGKDSTASESAIYKVFPTNVIPKGELRPPTNTVR